MLYNGKMAENKETQASSSPEKRNSSSRKEVLHTPVWQKHALSWMPLMAGNTVVFPNTEWNPEVTPGQKIPQSKLKTFVLPEIEAFSKQVNVLYDPAGMKRIAAFIDAKYGRGVGKNIANLTPRDAVILAHTILSERTEYDYDQMDMTVGGDKRIDLLSKLRMKGGSMTEKEFFQHNLADRHSNDILSAESILKNEKDKDTVCRNKSQMMIVIFEAIKLLQVSDTSQLNTTRIALLANPIAKDGLPYGTLEPEGVKVYKVFSSGEFVALRSDEAAVSSGGVVQKKMPWKIRLLSNEEQKRVRIAPDLQEMLKYRYWDDRTEGELHQLVQVMTQDKNGRTQAFPFDVTSESFDDAETSGRRYVWDALNVWKKDSSWVQMRHAAHAMIQNLPEGDPEKELIRSKFPLLFLLSAKEQRSSPNKAEIDFCTAELVRMENRYYDEAWYNPQYTSETEQEMLTNIGMFFIECVPCEKLLAKRVLNLCMKVKPKVDAIPELSHFNDKVAYLRELLLSKK